MIWMLLTACTTEGPAGAVGPSGPPGPAGPIGAAGAPGTASVVPFHWRTRDGEIASPGPHLELFDADGVAWSIDRATGLPGPIRVPLVYWEESRCSGKASIEAYDYLQALDVDGALRAIPPDVTPGPFVGRSVHDGVVCLSVEYYEREAMVSVGDLIAVGPAPVPPWQAGGLHRVPGAP